MVKISVDSPNVESPLVVAHKNIACLPVNVFSSLHHDLYTGEKTDEAAPVMSRPIPPETASPDSRSNYGGNGCQESYYYKNGASYKNQIEFSKNAHR